jgi:hypothetical protein
MKHHQRPIAGQIEPGDGSPGRRTLRLGHGEDGAWITLIGNYTRQLTHSPGEHE